MPPTRSGPGLLRGTVEDGRPFVEVELLDPAEYLPRAVVDTGLSGAIVVPTGTLQRWQRLESAGWTTVGVANDDVQAVMGLSITIKWFGKAQRVFAVELGSEFIIGTELLIGTTIALSTNEVIVTTRQ